MSTLTASPRKETGSPPGHQGWFTALLRRLHFYAGIFVGPFILVAAISGGLYSITPQLEKVVYAEQLSVPVAQENVPLANQIEAANTFIGPDQALTAVRPAPEPGATTRVLYAGEGLGEGESRAIFVDPATAEVRGDLTVYGSSGALPMRTWIDQLHRSLLLGDVGRLYSELAASWLGVIAVAGLGLWIVRARRLRAKRKTVWPNRKDKGLKKTVSWHATVGVWAALGMLFLSATGITWSQYAGENVSKLRTALSWTTPAVSTAVDGSAPAGGEHGGHQASAPADPPPGSGPNPATFDAVLSVAQGANVDTGQVEITPPEAEGSAWVVQELQRSFPTEVDSVAVNGKTLEVSDRVDFEDYPVAAKLSRWGIDLHMGAMFGLVNQLVLLALAIGTAGMVVWGYVMWWQRRPGHNPGRRFGVLPPRGALRQSPPWAVVLVVLALAALGWFLPLLGLSLAAFVLVDFAAGWWSSRRAPGSPVPAARR